MRQYLTRNGAARMLGVAQSRIRQMEREGLILAAGQADSGNGNRVWLFTEEHVEALRQRRAERAKQPKVAH